MWFIDRHPMRVFKWTPDFDPFFESPIAALWCNLVGLLIHLFEKSALFAIGSLLGVPIQVDHDIISQSRLSFARICIEIDISKAPREEVILVFQGKEVRQPVKWDQIPLHCHECKHVGHTNDVCYVNGQRPRPLRRDFPSYAEKKRVNEEVLAEEGKGESERGGAGKVDDLVQNVIPGQEGKGEAVDGL